VVYEFIGVPGAYFSDRASGACREMNGHPFSARWSYLVVLVLGSACPPLPVVTPEPDGGEVIDGGFE
jgi:hypothetical protein